VKFYWHMIKALASDMWDKPSILLGMFTHAFNPLFAMEYMKHQKMLACQLEQDGHQYLARGVWAIISFVAYFWTVVGFLIVTAALCEIGQFIATLLISVPSIDV